MSIQVPEGRQQALELFDLDGVDDLEAFGRFVDVMRRHHRGRDNAIQSKYLARILFGSHNGTSTVRDYKQVAVHELGIPIAYASGEGYYVIETVDELESVKERYYKEITSRKETVAALERAVTGSHTWTEVSG